jgi:hypothetical protein
MFPSNDHVIRAATAADSHALQQLAGAGPPLPGRVLIGEVAGEPAAALSMADGRLYGPGRLGARLRMRAAAIRAYERTPSVRLRLRQGIRVATATR